MKNKKECECKICKPTTTLNLPNEVKELSKCCGYPKIVHEGGEGTSYYACGKCGNEYVSSHSPAEVSKECKWGGCKGYGCDVCILSETELNQETKKEGEEIRAELNLASQEIKCEHDDDLKTEDVRCILGKEIHKKFSSSQSKEEGWSERFDKLNIGREMENGLCIFRNEDNKKLKDFIKNELSLARTEGMKEAELDNTRDEWIDHKIKKTLADYKAEIKLKIEEAMKSADNVAKFQNEPQSNQYIHLQTHLRSIINIHLS